MLEVEEDTGELSLDDELIDYNPPTPFVRTGKAITDTLEGIAGGKVTGEYPTIESIVSRSAAKPARPGQQWQPERPVKQTPPESPAPAADSRSVIEVHVIMSDRSSTLSVAIIALLLAVLAVMMAAYMFLK